VPFPAPLLQKTDGDENKPKYMRTTKKGGDEKKNSLPMAMSWRFFFAASSTSAVNRFTSDYTEEERASTTTAVQF
jgi:hypothetical protein